tara:strand:+ start:236 stop:985 length:750 start_codon:yes stop_codon:yes gene_type:complete
MCILFISRKKNSSWPLLIATNRDEFYNREFDAPGVHWKGYPAIYAGKDKTGGGSWLGINTFGVCVAILNRNTKVEDKNFESRGNLVINALKFKSAVEAKNKVIQNFQKKYKYFNLFIADINDAYLIKYDNFKLDTFSVPYGKSIIDNFNLNDNNSLKQTLNKNYFYEAPHPIPEKNQFDGWSKLLSINSPNKSEKVNSIYVKDRQNNYGTVCSSIIGLPKIKTNTKGIFWLYRKSGDSPTAFKKLKLFI